MIFLNSNIPEKRYRIFQRKEDLNELPDDSANVFQGNILDCYLDRPDRVSNGKCAVIDSQCFAEFLSFYYHQSKSKPELHNNSQPVVLDDELMETNHLDPQLIKTIRLMLSKEKLKCKKLKQFYDTTCQMQIEMLTNMLTIYFFHFIHFGMKEN